MFRLDEHYPRDDVNPWFPDKLAGKKHIVPTDRRRMSYARIVIDFGFVGTRDHNIDICETW
jgi:hypothetical protein